MKANKISRNLSSYLDVSEFIIREPSPLIKPSSPPLPVSLEVTVFDLYAQLQVIECFLTKLVHVTYARAYILHLFHTIQSYNLMHTPEISPIDHDPSQFYLTPHHGGLLSDELHDLAGDFFLEQHKGCSSEKKEGIRKKRTRREETPENHYIQLFKIENDLDDIFSEDEISLSVIAESDDSDDQSEDENEDMAVSEVGKRHSLDYSSKGNYDERQSTIDISQVDYTEIIQKFSLNPKQEMLRNIKEIGERKDIQDQYEKKNLLKDFLAKYLLQYEIHCYEQSWFDMNDALSLTIFKIVNKLEETFAKRIGFISFQERRVKLLKYLQKKKRRIWRKKVSYDCRKKVADGRLRIKGKFVTRDQACQQLGLKSLENYSAEEIKDMLQRKLDLSLIQSVED